MFGQNGKFSQNGKFGQNGMSGQKGKVHLGPNVSSSAHYRGWVCGQWQWCYGSNMSIIIITILCVLIYRFIIIITLLYCGVYSR